MEAACVAFANASHASKLSKSWLFEFEHERWSVSALEPRSWDYFPSFLWSIPISSDQVETLPVHVRDAQKWTLYVKLCFFQNCPFPMAKCTTLRERIVWTKKWYPLNRETSCWGSRATVLLSFGWMMPPHYASLRAPIQHLLFVYCSITEKPDADCSNCKFITTDRFCSPFLLLLLP